MQDQLAKSRVLRKPTGGKSQESSGNGAIAPLPVGLCYVVLRANFASGHRWKTGCGLTALYFIVGLGIFGVEIPLAFFALLACLVASVLSQLLVPPVILFLGSSQPNVVDLFCRIRVRIHPLRTVALLNMTGIGWVISGDVARDNLRTIDDSMWRRVVHPLMDAVALVVMDARIPSPAVVDEAIRVMSSANIGKTLFVSQDGNRSAVEAAAKALHIDATDIRRFHCVVVEESHLMEYLAGLCFRKREKGTVRMPLS